MQGSAGVNQRPNSLKMLCVEMREAINVAYAAGHYAAAGALV